MTKAELLTALMSVPNDAEIHPRLGYDVNHITYAPDLEIVTFHVNGAVPACSPERLVLWDSVRGQLCCPCDSKKLAGGG